MHETNIQNLKVAFIDFSTLIPMKYDNSVCVNNKSLVIRQILRRNNRFLRRNLIYHPEYFAILCKYQYHIT